jgi:hypothetical protein
MLAMLAKKKQALRGAPVSLQDAALIVLRDFLQGKLAYHTPVPKKAAQD